MREIEFRIGVNEVSFQQQLELYVGGRKLPIFLTEELIYDLGAIGGLDAAEEVFEIITYEINAAMFDVEFGLTLEEVSKIKELIKEKIKHE